MEGGRHMFTSIINTAEGLTILSASICTLSSILLGFIIALVYMRCGPYSKTFAVSLVLLPPLVQVVIMMVNGNLGAGVAVLGAFSLVRFRSTPGSAKEICAIFFAMAVGLATGMGYVTFAAAVTVVISLVMLLVSMTRFAEKGGTDKTLRITIPENLDYTDVFDDLFVRYTKKYSLESVKTTNLGSLFELTYHITLKDIKKEKSFLDEIRCRNGNLTVICSRAHTVKDEL